MRFTHEAFVALNRCDRGAAAATRTVVVALFMSRPTAAVPQVHLYVDNDDDDCHATIRAAVCVVVDALYT